LIYTVLAICPLSGCQAPSTHKAFQGLPMHGLLHSLVPEPRVESGH
jgi:hypothetical protein